MTKKLSLAEMNRPKPTTPWQFGLSASDRAALVFVRDFHARGRAGVHASVREWAERSVVTNDLPTREALLRSWDGGRPLTMAWAARRALEMVVHDADRLPLAGVSSATDAQRVFVAAAEAVQHQLGKGAITRAGGTVELLRPWAMMVGERERDLLRVVRTRHGLRYETEALRFAAQAAARLLGWAAK